MKQVVAGITDAEVRELFLHSKPLKSQWYPFSVLIDVSIEIDKLFGTGDLSLLEEAGGDVAEADLSSVYKIFFKVANPHFIIDRAAAVWRNYYSSGECVVADSTEKSVVLEIRDFDTPHRAHCLGVLGWTKRTLMLTGCKEVRAVHSQCRCEGAKVCRFEGSWK